MARASLEARYLHRLHAVLLVAGGCSCYEVGCWFHDSPRSVERWVHAYQAKGLAGLRDRLQCGPSCRVPSHVQQELVALLRQSPAACGYSQQRWSGKLLARHLTGCHGLQLGERQCQRLMRRLH